MQRGSERNYTWGKHNKQHSFIPLSKSPSLSGFPPHAFNRFSITQLYYFQFLHENWKDWQSKRWVYFSFYDLLSIKQQSILVSVLYAILYNTVTPHGLYHHLNRTLVWTKPFSWIGLCLFIEAACRLWQQAWLHSLNFVTSSLIKSSGKLKSLPVLCQFGIAS